MKPEPTNMNMYERVKRKVYASYKTHSAYRSGMLVKLYKKEFTKKYGNKRSPYDGKKPSKKDTGLKRWFAEEWKANDGKIGYRKKGDVYRPTKRVTKKTPITFNELTKSEIKKAKKEKKEKGRVKRFRKT